MDQEPVADHELIARCRRGDHEAFTMLYERYRLQLFSYLNRMFPGRGDTVDDLFQQVWIKALDSLDGYTDQQRFVAWIYRIAHNQAIDLLRRESRHRTEEITENTAHDEAPPPWEAIDRETLTVALEEAIERLGPDQREVLTLRQQGFSFKEIAAMQHTGINTVLGRMHYALKNLRRHLAASIPDADLR